MATIILTRFGLINPSRHKMIDFLKMVFMTLEILMLEDDSYLICGEVRYHVFICLLL